MPLRNQVEEKLEYIKEIKENDVAQKNSLVNMPRSFILVSQILTGHQLFDIECDFKLKRFGNITC